MVHAGLVERADRNPKVPVWFYRTEAGGSPVLDWLRALDKEARLILCFHDRMLVVLREVTK